MKIVTLYLDDGVQGKLQAIATKKGLKTNQYIKMILLDMLEKNQQVIYLPSGEK